MPITTVDDLRNDKGWEPTPRLRWLKNILQQRWERPSDGATEWRAIEEAVE